jgi:putative ATP-binding cassette transporter
MTGFVSTFTTTRKLTTPYFRSERRWAGRLLLGAIIVIELSIVAIHVMINKWNSRFFNAIQDRNLDAFGAELMNFCMLAAAFILLAVYQQYLSQWLRIRWREWMTRHLLERWLGSSAHYRMQLVDDPIDNPDQRIAEDVSVVRRPYRVARHRLARSSGITRVLCHYPVGPISQGAAAATRH